MINRQAVKRLEKTFNHGGLGYDENFGGCGFMAIFGYEGFKKLGVEPEVFLTGTYGWTENYTDHKGNLIVDKEIAHEELATGDWSLGHVLLRVKVDNEWLFFDSEGFRDEVCCEVVKVDKNLLDVLVECDGWNNCYDTNNNDTIKAIYERAFSEAAEVNHAISS